MAVHVDTGRALPARRLLLLSTWFGLATGFVEVALRLLEEQSKGLLLYGPQLFWMAPLANVLIFAGVAAALLALGRWWPRLTALRPATFVFLTLGLVSALFIFEALHRLAAALLAVGLALHLSRWIAARPGGLRLLVRRTAGWAAALVLGFALAIHGLDVVRERVGLARLPAAAPGAPNVLLIVLDTVRAQNMSLHGYSRHTTPALERFARRGVRFESALSPESWTSPSHTSLMNGRFPHEVRIDLGHAPIDPVPTLAEVLAAHGYATAGFSANMEYAGYEQGLDRGFARFEDYPVSLGELAVSSSLIETFANHRRVRRITGIMELLSRKRAEDVGQDLLDWLNRRDGRPFFAFLNYYDAHGPYLPPPPFDTLFGALSPRVPHTYMGRQGRWHRMWGSPQEIRAEVAAYDGALAHLDHELGRLFTRLHARGILDDTIVIVTSDHGEQFGEHGLFFHRNSLYRQLLHVPLVVVFPRGRLPAGTSVRDPVSIRDVPATILDLVGLEAERDRFPGSSLARHWEPAAVLGQEEGPNLSDSARWSRWPHCGWVARQLPWPPAAPPENVHKASLVAEGYHYIWSANGREELYDFERDPDEVDDLAGTTSGQKVVRRLRATIDALICATGEHGPARVTAEEFVFTEPPETWTDPMGLPFVL